MSKKDILRAATKKGITFDELYFNRQCVTPGEIVSAWEIRLSEESENAIFAADPAFMNINPDVWNTPMVLEWIDTIPDLTETTKESP